LEQEVGDTQTQTDGRTQGLLYEFTSYTVWTYRMQKQNITYRSFKVLAGKGKVIPVL